MRTNLFKSHYDYEAISRDFLIFRIAVADKSDRAHLPRMVQIVQDEFHPLGVFYAYGGWAFLTFSRPSTAEVRTLAQRLREHPRLAAATVVEIQITQAPKVKPAEDATILFGHWVTGLLLNCLPALLQKSRRVELPASVANGRMYLVVKGPTVKALNFEAWQVNFNKQQALHLARGRFERLTPFWHKQLIKAQNWNKQSFWLWEAKSATLNAIHLPVTDEDRLPSNVFFQPDMPWPKKERATGTFFVTGKERDFEDSKVGALFRVLKLADRLLKPWIRWEPLLEDWQTYFLTNDPKKLPQRVQTYFAALSVPIEVLDVIHEPPIQAEAKELVKTWQENFPKLPVPACVSELHQAMPQIAMIYSKDHYEENPEQDDYLKTRGPLVQHWCIGTPGKMKDKLTVCLKELALKQDLHRRKAEFLEWKKYGFAETYTFIRVHFNSHRDPERRLALVHMHPDGSLESSVDRVLGTESFRPEIEALYNQLVSARNDFVGFGPTKDAPYQVEGAVMKGGRDLNLIYRSEAIALPNPDLLQPYLDKLYQELPESLRPAKAFADLLREALPHRPDVADHLEQQGGLVNRGLLKQLYRELSLNKGETQAINKIVQLSTGLLANLPRAKVQKHSLLRFKMNLQWRQEGEQLAYIVGYSDAASLKTIFQKASHIRYVIPAPGHSLFFKELFPTLDDNSIRVEENTVLPAPFKYLTEVLESES